VGLQAAAGYFSPKILNYLKYEDEKTYELLNLGIGQAEELKNLS